MTAVLKKKHTLYLLLHELDVMNEKEKYRESIHSKSSVESLMGIYFCLTKMKQLENNVLFLAFIGFVLATAAPSLHSLSSSLHQTPLSLPFSHLLFFFFFKMSHKSQQQNLTLYFQH